MPTVQTPPILATIHNIPITSSRVSDTRFLKDPKFTNWIHKLASNFSVNGVNVTDVYWFGRNLGFMNCQVDAVDSDGDKIPGLALVRGDCCAVLIILDCEGVQYAVNVTESRVPVAGMHTQAVAGMLDDAGTPGGRIVKKVLDEVTEETGLDTSTCDIINMSEGMQRLAATKGLSVSQYWKTTAGTTDEGIINFAIRIPITMTELCKLEGRVIRNSAENEKCLVSYVPLDYFGMIADSKNKALMNDYNMLMKENMFPKSWYPSPWYMSDKSILMGIGIFIFAISYFM